MLDTWKRRLHMMRNKERGGGYNLWIAWQYVPFSSTSCLVSWPAHYCFFESRIPKARVVLFPFKHGMWEEHAFWEAIQVIHENWSRAYKQSRPSMVEFVSHLSQSTIKGDEIGTMKYN